MNYMRSVNKPVSFGRNETFYLKYNWIYKSLSALEENKEFFAVPNSYLDLGVGKNMLVSIKYWMGAYQILDKSKTQYKDDLAKSIFDPKTGYDPFLEREETLWLLHWRLCFHPEQASLYYWFFNKFKNTRFTKDEIKASLYKWLEYTTTKQISPNTIERDINLLLKTYASVDNASESLEESLENPFPNLDILHKNSDGTFSAEYKHRDIIECNLFTLLVTNLIDHIEKVDLLTSKDLQIIPLREIIDSAENPSIKNILRLTDNCLMNLVEQMTINFSEHFDLSETAGQKNLIVKNKKINYQQLLEEIYK